VLGDRIAFVQADLCKGQLATTLKVAAPHVVIHHDIVQFPEPGRSARTLHDLNIIGTLQLLAACAEVSGLRSLIVRSSAAIYGSESDAPAFFTEAQAGGGSRGSLPTRFQRDIRELERLVEAFARRHPSVICTVLRLQPELGPTLDTPIMRLFRAPVVPTFLGFDPRLQFVLDDDAIGAIAASVKRPVRGAVNIAGEGTVSLSRMLRRMGKAQLPVMSPLYGFAVGALRRVGACPPGIDRDVMGYLRHGRGVDTTRMRRDLRFVPTHTTIEAVDAVAAAMRAPERASAG
jgi:UDP-glucose 4-epimerase